MLCSADEHISASCRDSISQPSENILSAHSSLPSDFNLRASLSAVRFKRLRKQSDHQNTLLLYSLSQIALATDLRLMQQAKSNRVNSSSSHLPRTAFGISLEKAHSRINQINIFSIIDTTRYIAPCSIKKDSLGKFLRGAYFIDRY